MADRKILKSDKSLKNPLQFYLNEISKVPLLTRDEEERLAILAKNGDKSAKEKLINANLRFVVAIAKKYRYQGIPLGDLINEGNIGLITAIEKFDVERGNHFISYAVWWIRQAILKAICEKSRMIRLPLNRANELVQIEKMRKELEKMSDDEITSEKIADNLSLDHEMVKHLMEISKQTISLEKPLNSNESDSSILSDMLKDNNSISPEDKYESKSLTEEINGILKSLTEKEKNIIEMRYGLNGFEAMSLKEIGDKYDLTKERIRQIEKKAITRLKSSKKTETLKNYIM